MSYRDFEINFRCYFCIGYKISLNGYGYGKFD